MRPPAQLLVGRTTHRRETPFVRAFTHGIAMVELDIDRLDEVARLSPFMSVDRFNAVAFHQADQGGRAQGDLSGVNLRAWAEARFAEHGVNLHGGGIRLVAFPRVWGYGFSPISIWFGHDPEGGLRSVIYEVRNTFGETHSYVCAFDPSGVQAESDKDFHVSPFFDRAGRYRFTLRNRDTRLNLTVENIDATGRSHVASLNVSRVALTSTSILKVLISMPVSGLGVVFAIHWQALLLWLRGARYRDKPVQKQIRTTPVERLSTRRSGETPIDDNSLQKVSRKRA